MVVADTAEWLTEPRRLPTVTLGGWREFVDTKAAELEVLTPREYAALTCRAREDYNERRLAYHRANDR